MARSFHRQLIFGLAALAAVLLAAAFVTPTLVPDADPADFVTRQTARVALVFWGIATAALLLDRRDLARAGWAVGAGTFLVHVATAFDRVHGWSHGAAYRHVEAVSGFGPGVFASYAFTALWVADAGWWWIDPRACDARPAWLDRLVHGFMAFVVFNGTVVYETGFIRRAGVVAFAILGMLFVVRRRGTVTPAA
jgi:hypothetical protein